MESSLTLTKNDDLIEVVSFGFCQFVDLSKFANVFTRVRKYYLWIIRNNFINFNS
jgi:hypothetical protein